MPIMVVGRCHIGPSSTSQSSENADSSNDLGKGRVGARSEDVPQEDKRESRAGGNGDEDLEEGPFGVTVTNGRGHGGEPFNWVAEVFVLDDLVVMQSHADNQRTDEGRVGEECVSPRDPFAVDLYAPQVSGASPMQLSIGTYGDHGISVLVSGSHGGAEGKASSAPVRSKEQV